MKIDSHSGDEADADCMFRRTSSVDLHAGLGAIARITRMAFRYRIRAGLALIATVAAVLMQLSIPVLLGRAVDETQSVAAAKAEPETLYGIAILLFVASVARGIFTLVQNYTPNPLAIYWRAIFAMQFMAKFKVCPFPSMTEPIRVI